MEKTYFTETEKRLLSKAYDNIYNLNSYMGYKFDYMIIDLNKLALSKGYVFKLNERTQKFNLKEVVL